MSRESSDKRKAPMSALFWAPRIITILFALSLGVFALDVFDEGRGVPETLAAFVLHLVPALLVVAILLLAWRRELVGVVAFAGLALAYVVFMWGRFPWVTYAAISGPLLLMSALFFLSWRRRAGG